MEIVGRRYHFNVAGGVYVLTTVVMLIGAINGANNLLLWLFGLGVAGLLVSGLLSGAALMGVRVERMTPERVRVGERLRVTYVLRSRGRLVPAFALEVEEVERAGWWGKWRGEWTRCLKAGRGAAPMLRAGGRATATAEYAAVRRGEAVFGPCRVSTLFPFGLTRKSVTCMRRERVIVWPRAVLSEQDQSRLSRAGEPGASRRGVQGTGEFYALREFRPGDPVRSVAWRATARLGRVVVKELVEHPGERVWIMLPPGDTGEALEAAIERAAGLAAHVIERGWSVGLVLEGERQLLPAKAGMRHLREILDVLALYEGAVPASGRAPVWVARARDRVIDLGEPGAPAGGRA